VTGAKFKPGDKVLHKRASTLGVGTVRSVRIRDDHPVGGFWYLVVFSALDDGRTARGRDEFAEGVMRFSVLDQLASL